MGSQITSTISTVWDFTTKSGGIWNIALFPEEEHAHMQGMVLESLPKQLSGEDVGVLLSTIETLIARKHLLYPQVREYIRKHTLSLSNNTVTLTVSTAPVPEKIQR